MGRCRGYTLSELCEQLYGQCCVDNHECQYILGMFCCTVDHRLRVLLLESLRMEGIMKPFVVSSVHG